MAKKISIILSIIFTIIIALTTVNYAVSDTNGIFLGLKGKSIESDTGLYTFNNKAVFKIVKYNK